MRAVDLVTQYCGPQHEGRGPGYSILWSSTLGPWTSVRLFLSLRASPRDQEKINVCSYICPSLICKEHNCKIHYTGQGRIVRDYRGSTEVKNLWSMTLITVQCLSRFDANKSHISHTCWIQKNVYFYVKR